MFTVINEDSNFSSVGKDQDQLETESHLGVEGIVSMFGTSFTFLIMLDLD